MSNCRTFQHFEKFSNEDSSVVTIIGLAVVPKLTSGDVLNIFSGLTTTIYLHFNDSSRIIYQMIVYIMSMKIDSACQNKSGVRLTSDNNLPVPTRA